MSVVEVCPVVVELVVMVVAAFGGRRGGGTSAAADCGGSSAGGFGCLLVLFGLGPAEWPCLLVLRENEGKFIYESCNSLNYPYY